MQLSVLLLQSFLLIVDVSKKALSDLKLIPVHRRILFLAILRHEPSVLQLFGHKTEFSLRVSNFLLKFALVESLLGYDLAAKVLDLRSSLFLYSVVLLAHDVTPDHVQVVEDLRHTSL